MSLPIFKISTHILDTNKGRPVCDLPVRLYRLKSENEWILLGESITTINGRVDSFITDNVQFVPGTYKLTFCVKKYYDSLKTKTMYPFIDLIFDVEKSEHYHMPLLLNAFGFTTYRGS